MTISPREVSNSTDIPVVRKRSFKTAAVSLFITVCKSSTSCRSAGSTLSPSPTAFIFASWKEVVTGPKSEDDSDSRLASLTVNTQVQKLGFRAKFSEFYRGQWWCQVTNIFVFTCSLVLFTVWPSSRWKGSDRVNGRKGDSSFSSLLQVCKISYSWYMSL